MTIINLGVKLMSSEFGNKIKLSIFGESHGEAIGCVIDSLPAGVKLDMDKIYFDMARRAPGKDKTATPRLEKDIPHILSGVLDKYFLQDILYIYNLLWSMTLSHFKKYLYLK